MIKFMGVFIMCAIGGFCKPCSNKFINSKKWQYILNLINKVQRHRGPDKQEIFLKPDCGLAHSRLSIIDLNRGTQPMSASFKGQTQTIVYNGEIYNFKEFRL